MITPDKSAQLSLELDELWFFVKRKSNKRWIWLALCKQTLQVVASVIGGRGFEALNPAARGPSQFGDLEPRIETCQQLWANVPALYEQGLIFTDFWEVYQAVIPQHQHQPVGKDSGLTAHVERFNNTIRQRLARFVRKSLSFSMTTRTLSPSTPFSCVTTSTSSMAVSVEPLPTI